MALTQSQVRQRFVKAYPGQRIWGRKGFWYRCAHCGRLCGRAGGEKANLQDYEKMEVDHIRPWSLGGSDELWNLQPLCRPCNRTKSNNMTAKDKRRDLIHTVQHPVQNTVVSATNKAKRDAAKAAKKIPIVGAFVKGRR